MVRIKENTGEIKRIFSEHPDYKKNMKFVANFIKNCSGKLPAGMSIKVSNSEGMNSSILMVAWSPVVGGKLNASMGNFAAPICLHNGHDIFKEELKSIFNGYHAMAEAYWERNPIEHSQYIKEIEEIHQRDNERQAKGQKIAVPDMYVAPPKRAVKQPLHIQGITDKDEDFF